MMATLLLRANNRWPRTVTVVLGIADGRYLATATAKLLELAAPVLEPALAALAKRRNT